MAIDFELTFMSIRSAHQINLLKSLLLASVLVMTTFDVTAMGVCASAPNSSFTVNIKDKGAVGNGDTDDTVAIQMAVDQVTNTGGRVLVPDGIYLVNAVTGIRVGSNMTLSLSKGAIFKAMPNDKESYSLLKIFDADNVTVTGGKLVGERDVHIGTTGEWGFGIHVRGATNIVIEGVTVENTWGDAFYVAGGSRNVKFCSVVANNNRRQGMSIISVDGLLVTDSIFKNTGGTPPGAGIDIEPNANDTVSNVLITKSKFLNNKGSGIILSVHPKFIATIFNVKLEGNFVSENKRNGIDIGNTESHTIIGNYLYKNERFGIFLDKHSKTNSVTNNVIAGAKGIRDDGRNIILNNTVN